MTQRTEAGSEEDAGWIYDTLSPWQLASWWNICIGSKMGAPECELIQQKCSCYPMHVSAFVTHSHYS